GSGGARTGPHGDRRTGLYAYRGTKFGGGGTAGGKAWFGDPPAAHRRGHAGDERTRPGQTSYGASRQPSRAVYVRIYQQRDRGERDARRRAFFPAEAFHAAGSNAKGTRGFEWSGSNRVSRKQIKS